MKERPADEKALLRLVSEGDESAFRKIYDAYHDHIYNAAFAFTKSPHIAEDIVQEAFCKVWYKRSLLPSVEKFDAWLFIIARNQIMTELKSRMRHSEFVEYLRKFLTESEETPLQDLISRESESIIRDAVEILPPQQKAVFSLSREEGLSQEEIALKLNISKNTVRNHMNAALKFIRHYILLQHAVAAALLIKLF